MEQPELAWAPAAHEPAGDETGDRHRSRVGDGHGGRLQVSAGRVRVVDEQHPLTRQGSDAGQPDRRGSPVPHGPRSPDQAVDHRWKRGRPGQDAVERVRGGSSISQRRHHDRDVCASWHHAGCMVGEEDPEQSGEVPGVQPSVGSVGLVPTECSMETAAGGREGERRDANQWLGQLGGDGAAAGAGGGRTRRPLDCAQARGADTVAGRGYGQARRCQAARQELNRSHAAMAGEPGTLGRTAGCRSRRRHVRPATPPPPPPTGVTPLGRAGTSLT